MTLTTEHHQIASHKIAKYHGKLQILNDTDISLAVTCDQIETPEGTKYVVTIKSPPDKQMI